MKKTKIVCTIGPASEDESILRELILNGMNVARLNFSHGVHSEHKERIDTIKKVREELDLPIGIMLDTRGPEIRIGRFKDEEIRLEIGDIFTLTSRDVMGDKNIVTVCNQSLPRDVEKGSRILIDDGLVEMIVEEVIDGTDIRCRLLNSGVLSDRKGVNVPDISTDLPPLTDKDVQDIKFGIDNDVEFIAASFIRTADDVFTIRKVLEQNGGEDIEIISKIENQEGLDNIEEIIDASDGIMVARGDLGVEILTQEVPLAQKRIIRSCNIAGKPVITATQMLDSMMRNPRPTRAEVADVANAILDGSDAIMLSGETAAGKHPVESVQMMHNIAVETENSTDYMGAARTDIIYKDVSTTNAISRATCTTARDLGASAIITATSSGYTSRAISKFKPNVPIIAATTRPKVTRKLSLVWGVYPVIAGRSNTTDEVVDASIDSALERGYVREGDLVVMTAGIPVGVTGTTNLIKVHTVGKVLARGIGIGKGSVSGRVCIGSSREELEGKFEEGNILVGEFTDRYMVEYMEQAAAIVVERGGLTSHAAIVGLNYHKPTIVGVGDVTNILKDGEMITVDATGGRIYKGEARVL
ncbi:MAG: pyruvate kinase [Tissierellia bacterium]|nr:pyruvate kinase [Tissierellia bacterium]